MITAIGSNNERLTVGHPIQDGVVATLFQGETPRADEARPTGLQVSHIPGTTARRLQESNALAVCSRAWFIHPHPDPIRQPSRFFDDRTGAHINPHDPIVARFIGSHYHPDARVGVDQPSIGQPCTITHFFDFRRSKQR